MRVFLAGATGVIGKRVVPLLIRAGHDVTAVARTPEKDAELHRQGASPIQIDLFDAAAVRHAVHADVVINLATSIPPVSRALLPWAWRENSRIRRTVSANLVDAAIANGAERFIQESFAPIYADGGNRWLDERSRIKPARYNRAVLAAERHAERFTEHDGVGVALRFAFFYGPDSEFTSAMIAAARKGRAAAFGSPEDYISSIAHDDAATAVVAALDVPAGVYNVGDDEPVTRRSFFGSLARALDAPVPRFPPSWLYHFFGSIGETLARSQRISNRKFKDASRWIPEHQSIRSAWRHVVYARLGRAEGGHR